ncbi:GNAT family N-acetyltransferase [Candidatus Binatia bacterium]|nr:GNAT family N-acetyltransferase [Candidatus Binatia bacterium]
MIDTNAARVAPLDEAGAADAGAMLGRAFFDDPLWRWVLPDDARRREVLGAFMTIGVRYGIAHGHVDATAGREGCAVWLRPGDAEFDPERGMAVGLGEAPQQLGEEGFGRFLAAMAHLTEPHRRLEPAAHWYLMILGVEPAAQRRGLGAATLRPLLERADAAGVRCYLETQKAANVPFYRAQGFEVREETDVPGGGPHLWLLSRVPHPR